MLDVKVKIEMSKPVGSIGFGVPLILEEMADSVKPYTEYKSLAEVAKNYANTTKAYKVASTIFSQNNAPAAIAICSPADNAQEWLAEVDNLALGWRQLIVVNNKADADNPAVANIMTAIEATPDKMYFADVDVKATTAYNVSNIKRTVLVYAEATDDVPSHAAALVGATAGLEPGSFTYKNIILTGVKPQSLTDTEIETIHTKGGITFVTKAGDIVSTEGKCAGGEYIDIIDSQDYIISNIEYQTQKTLNQNNKIPYDNSGIAMLESVCVNVMKDAYNKGIIATNADGSAAYTVNYAMRENTEATDRAARRYIGGQFAFTLAGAIHTVEVTGEIII